MAETPLSDRIARLSEPQKEVLRLVRQAKKSEQIAAELGISTSAVGKRIEGAMRHLRVTRREIAAMLLEQAEAGWVPHTAETDPVAIADDSAPPPPQDAPPEGQPEQAPERLVGLSVRQRVDLMFGVIMLSLLVFGLATIASQLLQGAVVIAPAAPVSTD